MDNIKGLHQVGFMKDPMVNRGTPIPVYEIVTPTNKLDINTVEGWNALVEITEQKRKEKYKYE